MPRGQIISCLKACRMVANGFLYHVVRVKDLECEIPTIESVPVVRQFQEVFPNDLSRVPPEQEIDFSLIYYQIRILLQFFHIGWLQPH